MVHFFTTEQGNLLIRLLLAHIAGDFVLQSKTMADSKNWFSKAMLWHILIVFILTWLLTGLWLPAIIIAVLHWIIDSLKATAKQKKSQKEGVLFAADQSLHLFVIIAVWVWHCSLWGKIYPFIKWPFTDYSMSLLMLGYAFVIWPAGYFLQFVLKRINTGISEKEVAKHDKIEHGGKLIGRFERIIILTFVLLAQYDAIGFLVAGKGIMRFAQKDENLRSEYVLVGTMMSYAISILTGVMVNWLLSLANV